MGIALPYVVLRGKVFSGRREGEFYVNLYAKNIRKTLGINPYPGTLNVKLDSSVLELAKTIFSRERAHFIIDPPLPGLAKVYAWIGYIKCSKVYIVKPEKTHYSYDVIEIVADHSIRDRYGLRDGDAIEIVAAIDPTWKPIQCIEL